MCHEYLETLTLLVGSFQQTVQVSVPTTGSIVQCTYLVQLNDVYWALNQPFDLQLVQTAQFVFYSCKGRKSERKKTGTTEHCKKSANNIPQQETVFNEESRLWSISQYQHVILGMTVTGNWQHPQCTKLNPDLAQVPLSTYKLSFPKAINTINLCYLVNLTSLNHQFIIQLCILKPIIQ